MGWVVWGDVGDLGGCLGDLGVIWGEVGDLRGYLADLGDYLG